MLQLSAMVLREFSGFSDVSATYRCVSSSALVGARKNGKSIFAGKKVTGFSNTEEETVGGVKVL